MVLLDGKKISEEIKNEIKFSVEKLVVNGQRPPHLAAILVGQDGASLTYIGVKSVLVIKLVSNLLFFVIVLIFLKSI